MVRERWRPPKLRRSWPPSSVLGKGSQAGRGVVPLLADKRKMQVCPGRGLLSGKEAGHPRDRSGEHSVLSGVALR